MEAAEVLMQIKNGGLFKLRPEDFAGRRMSQPEVEAIFTALGAFWMYQGEPCAERAHALLKSGLHSNGFINCRAVLDYPGLCLLMANEMLKVVEESLPVNVLPQITGVAGSAYSALDLSYCLALLMSQKYGTQVKHIMAEKDDKGNPTIIRGGLDPETTVLVINELMTTGSGSTWETKEAVLKCNGEGKDGPKIVIPSFVLMHRSKEYELKDGSEVQAVFHWDIGNVEPWSCPWCAAGSKAIKPKQGNNWEILHGRA